MEGSYMPKGHGEVLGLSGFFYALKNLGVAPNGATPRILRDKAEAFCKKKEADLGSGDEVKFLSNACFLGYYTYHVLSALGFHDDYTSLNFSKDVTWPRGAALYETVFK